jgi:Na+-translocating ferredoxin:NAD+ oxidoreductase RnfA subunit
MSERERVKASGNYAGSHISSPLSFSNVIYATPYFFCFIISNFPSIPLLPKTSSSALSQTITFILVIAALVQMVEIVLKKVSPALYQALGIFLPLITTNCAVLGIAIITVQKDFDLLTGVIYATSIALGFALALILFAGIRERLEVEDTPKAMRGVPIALITAGLLAMAFMGFANVVPLP